jgi:hypothetical membrane protein
MSADGSRWLKISGACGIVTPVVAFTCILLAIAYYPPFSWTNNALSDLGVQEGATSILFNYGLTISGILAAVFGSGLRGLFHGKTLGPSGAMLFLLATVSLTAIGVFNENYEPMHWYASVAFFVLFPLSMLLIAAAFLNQGQMKLGLFTFAVAAIAASPWITYFAVRYVEGVAIPEAISALAASAWAIALGERMLKQASKQGK